MAEGSSNLYWTQNRFDAALLATTTDALGEGLANLYYTDARVASYITVSSTISRLGQTIELGTETTGALASTSLAAEVVVDSEIDSETELESLLGDVSNVFTNNDGALNDDDLSNNSTSDLSEGTNLYFTEARASTTALAVLAGTTTDALTEGSANLYYTDARVNALLVSTSSSLVVGTSSIALSANALAWV